MKAGKLAASIGLASGIISIGSLGSALPACAQDAPTVEGIETVVVTAQKRTENVQDVPASVSAITAKQLEAYHISSFGDLPALAPGLTVAEGRAIVQLNIRGINAGITQGTFESPIAASIDGFYVAHPSGLVGAFLDVDRVEVVEGPQGTLYGRNATAGAVNVITNAPTDRYELNLSAEYSRISDNGDGGAWGGKETVVANAPFDDGKIRARLAIAKEDHGGYFTRIDPSNNTSPEGDRHDISARLRVATDLSSDVVWNVEGDVYYANDHAAFGDFVGLTSDQDLVGVTVYGGRGVGPGRRIYYSDQYYANQPLIYGLSSTLDWTINNELTFRSLSGYRHTGQHNGSDFDASDVYLSAQFDEEIADQYSQELQILYNGEKFHGLAGFYYFQDEAGQDIEHQLLLGTAIPPVLAPLRLGGVNKTNAYAAFGDATYSLLDNLDVTFGARYSVEIKGGMQNSLLDLSGIGSPDTANITTLPDKTFYSFTPRALLKYRPINGVMLYASWSKGFKSGGYNIGDLGQNTPYNPEKITAYEIGAKTEFWDNRVQLNVSAFNYDYTDLQVNVNVAAQVLIENAASALVKGVELQGNALITDDLSVNAGVMFLDAHFLRGEQVDSLRGGPAQPLRGNRLPASAPITFNVGAQYDWHIDSGTLSPAVNVSFAGRRYFTALNEPDISQAPVTLLNASLMYQPEGGVWSFGIFGTNLTNAYVAEREYPGNPGAGMNVFVIANAPRVIGVRAGYKM
ncbi:MAG TPA: TonB-dependent receptor [Rhizomicrobium sp.]|nr:TonB-dependent receptor [Rhizomicrobium sp.]